MTWPRQAFLGIVMIGVLTTLPGRSPAQNGAAHYRDFTVSVDGNQSGEYHMAIVPRSDGSIAMSGETKVAVKKLGITVYRYSYSGTEIWQNGRLLQLVSSSDDDGKRFRVHAVAEANGLRVRVNGQERMARPDVWTTSYWRLPAAQNRQQAISLLDVDTGKDMNGSLQYLDTDRNGTKHYRSTALVATDLWYDQSGYLVRQEWVEDGHRTVVELARVRR